MTPRIPEGPQDRSQALWGKTGGRNNSYNFRHFEFTLTEDSDLEKTWAVPNPHLRLGRASETEDVRPTGMCLVMYDTHKRDSSEGGHSIPPQSLWFKTPPFAWTNSGGFVQFYYQTPGEF